jgi:predicted phosphodiesterase
VRIAIVSDIHANVDALAAVLGHVETMEGVDQLACLGDIVGYNAFPRETIALLREAGVPAVAGNHDLMVLGRIPASACGPRGRRAVEWTRGLLSPEDRQFLERLPGAIQRDDLLFVHSGLRSATDRLDSPARFAEEQGRLQRQFPHLRVCFTGHTHQQHVTEIDRSGAVRQSASGEVFLGADSFSFVNPGTVGEPRGADERAAFAVYDTDRRSVTFYRVAYDRRRVLRENARQGVGSAPRMSVATRFKGLLERAVSLVSSRPA